MFSNTASLRTFWPTGGVLTVKRRLAACLPASILVLACAGVSSPASARTAYDGDWSVVIMTRSGGCEPALRYGVQIDNGAVVNTGDNQATLQGRVSPGGAVRVNVRSGGAWATGSGRLRGNQGGGVWQGQGSSGACAGTWMAQRRAYRIQAQAPGEMGAPGTMGTPEEMGAPGEMGAPRAPIYDYAPGMTPQAPGIADRSTAFCQMRYRSYDPATGTFMGFDGIRHPCP